MVGTKGFVRTNRERLNDDDKQLFEKWRPLIDYLEEKNRNSTTILEVLSQIDVMLNKDKVLVSGKNHSYDKDVDTIELKTLSRNRTFRYKGSVKEGTTIFFGQNRVEVVKADQYKIMHAAFTGKRVQIGTSFNNPGAKSLGAWLQSNITKRAIASYVAPILIKERYATIPGENKTEIVFR
ncbi:hypothetical protein V7654_18825 [Bacillus sp. JJ1609]|uniref:hypothetical protein n=1 Tax=Bacillus sp. JJ1609 TaxID=3122977 RepID=UPI002FFE31AB